MIDAYLHFARTLWSSLVHTAWKRETGEASRIFLIAVPSMVLVFAGMRRWMPAMTGWVQAWAKTFGLKVVFEIPFGFGHLESASSELRGNETEALRSGANPVSQSARASVIHTIRNVFIEPARRRGLYATHPLPLRMSEAPSLVRVPDVVEGGLDEEFAHSEGGDILAEFGQQPSGRSLLIAGEPGSGKSTAMAILADVLCRQAEADPAGPLPVFANLSTYRARIGSLERWLVQVLRGQTYRLLTRAAASLLADGSLVLMLDGLDEMPVNERPACIRHINRFLLTHGSAGLAVSCRLADYDALPEKLAVQQAVVLSSISNEQLDELQRKSGSVVGTAAGLLRTAQQLNALAHTPLLLWIVSQSYEAAAQGGGVSSADGSVDDVFRKYVEIMLRRRTHGKKIDPSRLKRSLEWLATYRKRTGLKDFYVDRMQPDLLPAKSWMAIFYIASWLACALALFASNQPWDREGDATLWGFSLLFGAILVAVNYRIHPVESLALNWRRVAMVSQELLPDRREWRRSLQTARTAVVRWLKWVGICMLAFACGSLLSLAIAYFSGNFNDPPHWAQTCILILLAVPGVALLIAVFLIPFAVLCIPVVWPFLALTIGAPIWINLLLRGPALAEEQRRSANRGTWYSLGAAAMIGVCSLFCTVAALLLLDAVLGKKPQFAEAVPMGVMVCSLGALSAAIAFLQHYILRLLIWLSGCAPWRITNFLDRATERMLLFRVASGYRFVHEQVEAQFTKASVYTGTPRG